MADTDVAKKPEFKVSGQTFGAHGDNLSAHAMFSPSDEKWLNSVGISEPVKNVPLSEIGMRTADPIREKKIWSPKFDEYERTLKWGNSYHGRLAMRTASRFVVGSAAYSMAQIYLDHIFFGKGSKIRAHADGTAIEGRGYAGGEPKKEKIDKKSGEKVIDPQTGKPLEVRDYNPLKWAAFMIDETVGEGIQKTMYHAGKHIGRKGEAEAREFATDSVSFRRTREYGDSFDRDAFTTNEEVTKGIGLGREAVRVTADFAAMSFADYMTRYAISTFDPHGKSKWANKDGHLDIVGGLKELGTNTFRGAFYAAGQDAFAALPYVYFMKYMRHFLDKASPGFAIDNSLNQWGGSAKVKKVNDGGAAASMKGNSAKLPEYEIVGNYNLEGILDHTARFTFYNVMTQMYRDMYVAIQTRFRNFKNGTKTDPNPDASNNPLAVAKRATKYVAVTTTRKAFYMMPSAFVYGTIRASQGKHKGSIIDPESKTIIEHEKNGFVAAGDLENITSKKTGNVMADKEKYAFGNDMYVNGNKPPAINKVTNPLGKSLYQVTKLYTKGYNKTKSVFTEATGLQVTHAREGDFAKRWAEAGMAYTPYIMLSVDLASQYYDTNRTNFVLGNFYTALAETTKAVVTLKPEKVKSSVQELRKWANETWLAVLKQPSPTHEAHIQQLMNDVSQYRPNEAYQLEEGRIEDKYLRHEQRELTAAAETRAIHDEWLASVKSQGQPSAKAVKKSHASLHPRRNPITNIPLLERASSTSDPALSGRH